MDRIAFMIGERFIYWSPILVALSALAAAFLFYGFYMSRSGNSVGALLAVPMAVCISLVLSRLVHWYCKADSYASLLAALTDFSSGSFALCGAVVGCLLTAFLLRLTGTVKNLPEMLDTMALAGTAGIGLGRLSCLFNTADRGDLLEKAYGLPFSYPLLNAVTGQPEHRLATFMIQAMACGAIFLVLLVYWLATRKKNRTGNTFILFMLLYGASQVICDSTRYDSLFLRSNGFVSLVQILGAVGVVLAVVLFSVQLCRRRGWNFWYLCFWLVIGGCLGCAGYMEYYVQRHGDQAVFAYTVMTYCMLGVILICAIMMALTPDRKRTRS